jgi:hemerythrin-like domain-containing protein
VKATHILRQEHEIILKMLDAADDIASRLEQNTSVARDSLRDVVEFFQVFADRCHHSKEEDFLFPALEAKGLPRNGGPVGVMLFEHELGRATVRRMADALAAYESDPGAAGDAWAAASREYSALLRAHIQKENNILFVMAERLLTDAEQDQLSQAFARVETEKIGSGTHERLHGMVDAIAGKTCACAAIHNQ